LNYEDPRKESVLLTFNIVMDSHCERLRFNSFLSLKESERVVAQKHALPPDHRIFWVWRPRPSIPFMLFHSGRKHPQRR